MTQTMEPVGRAEREQSLFPKLTPHQIECLCPFGKKVSLPAGGIAFREGDAAEAFFVILEGQLRVTKQVAGEEMFIVVHEPGEFSGEISVLFGGACIATGTAQTACRLLKIEANAIKPAVMSCPDVTDVIVTVMAMRRPEAEAMTRQREKLVSLGVLAAGLAHELNNPAAAAQRATMSLRKVLEEQQLLALHLAEQALSAEQTAVLAEAARSVREMSAGEALSTLERSDREDVLEEWLSEQGITEPCEMAPALVEAGLTETHLAPIAAVFSGEGLSDALRWLQVTVQEAALLREMDESTRRITGLVKAVKEYSYMDQAPAQQVNLHEGLDSTLTMLNHKLKQAKVKVVRDYDPHLPTLFAYGSELNQVWTNLLDNAIDALSESPQAERVLTIRTAHVSDRVQVEITDNGPGIPEAIQNRIFDPFFTTKGVGQGTGLGLDIAFRIVVMRHHGDIKLHTEPGITRFSVCLPIEQ